MIYIQRHYITKTKQIKVISSYTLNVDLEEGLEYAEEVLNDLISIIYLKEENSNNLIKVELIGYQIVVSYVLDLFDFELECKNMLK